MLTSDAVAVEAAAIEDVRAFLRIDGTGEDAALTPLIAAAIEHCEAFTGTVVQRRGFAETIAPRADWTALSATPVGTILGVEAIAADGGASALAADAWAGDIDADGVGRVRLLAPVEAKRARVSFEAGYPVDWDALADGLKLGVARLVAHWHAHRDDAQPPTAVAAIWRPYRRLRVR